MTIALISNHVQQALDRLLEEYKGKPFITGMITALANQTQDEENVVFDMFTSRTIYGAMGKQLDELGIILGLPRPAGMDDATYRGLLLGKIGVNTSNGQIESVISFYKIFTLAAEVHNQELFPAGVMLMSDTEVIPALVNTLYSFLQIVVCIGVRVDHYGVWAGDHAFSFDGSGGGPDLGFGDSTDLAVGGDFAKVYFPNLPVFKFEDGQLDPDSDGFSDIRLDPILGGKFQGV